MKKYRILIFITVLLLFITISIPVASGQGDEQITVFEISVPRSFENQLIQQLAKNGYEITGREQGTVYMEYKGLQPSAIQNVAEVFVINTCKYWKFVLVGLILMLAVFLFIRRIANRNNSENCDEVSSYYQVEDYGIVGTINLAQRLADIQQSATVFQNTVPQYNYCYSQNFYNNGWYVQQPKIDYSNYDESNQFSLLKQYSRKWY